MLTINSWVEINTQNLKHNLNQFRRILSPGTQIGATVKSNAYGHGIIGVSQVIQQQTDWFCVVSLDEALELRRAKITKPILVLSFYFDQIDLAAKNNISLVVYNSDQIKQINLAAKKLHRIARVHLKLDTGTSRLGVGETEALKLITQITTKLKNLRLEGLFSHFAASEENQKFTDQQIQRFNDFVAKLNKLGINIPLKHFACSAAALVRPESQYNLIRLGISLYGLWPSKLAKRLTSKIYPSFNLQPALTWKTRVIAVKCLNPGQSIGYGCTYKTTKTTKIAVLPVGYWDGYDRHLSNKGEVLIHGQKCPIRGRVCMNLIIIDATKVKNVKINDEVVLIGQQGKARITAEDLAGKIGTINYEVVTRINPVLPRIMV
ncbi:MAG: alanine racemase [Patescibacteria group bacterium]